MSIAGILSEPTGQFRFPGTNNLLPSWQSLIVAFALRDNLAVNKYVQYQPTAGEATAMSNSWRYTWAELSRDDAIRVVGGNTDPDLWGIGTSRKDRGKDKLTRFRYRSGEMRRYSGDANVDWQVMKATGMWNVLQTEINYAVSRRITGRISDIWLGPQGIPNANWSAYGNSQSANQLNGGKGNWVNASNLPTSPNFNAIEQSLLSAVDWIEQMTNGEVTQKDLVLVLNPLDAIQIANAPEIRAIAQFNQQSLVYNQGFVPGLDKGLPMVLYGIPVVLEKSLMVTDPLPGSTDTATEAVVGQGRNYIMPSGSAYLLPRPGSLVGAPGSRSFSAIQIFYKDSLAQCQIFDDPEEEQSRIHVVETYDIQYPGLVAAMKITGILN